MVKKRHLLLPGSLFQKAAAVQGHAQNSSFILLDEEHLNMINISTQEYPKEPSDPHLSYLLHTTF